LDVFSICSPTCVTAMYYEFSSGYPVKYARGYCIRTLSKSASALSLR
jgi:hypothetical protein